MVLMMVLQIATTMMVMVMLDELMVVLMAMAMLQLQNCHGDGDRWCC